MGWSGRRTEMEGLVAAHAEPLYRYAYRLTGSHADADDLTQETFCKAQGRYAQLRDASRAKSWLFSIMRNAFLHRLRSERTSKQVPLDSVADLACNTVERNGDLDPQKLQLALNQLPEIYRSPLVLYYFEDFSYQDIAEQLAVPIGTVMSRLARAKGRMREILGDGFRGE